MDALVKPIEQLLGPLFRGLPSIPENSKRALVKYWPYLALIFGILQLFAVWGLWQLGHTTNALINYANDLSIAAGNGSVTPALGVFYYMGVISLAVDAIILLLAFGPLRAYSKKGWDLLVLGGVLNLLYGVLITFDSRYGGGFGDLLWALVASAVAFYFLFQVRDYYTGVKSIATGVPAPKPRTTTSTPPTTSTKTKV